MKKFLLLLLPILLCAILIACDFSGETTSTQDSSVNESSLSNASSEVEKEESKNANSQSVESSQISSSSDEIIEKSIDVSVTLTGVNDLEKAGFKVDSGFNKVISVTVKGEKSNIDNLAASDISAIIDLAGVTESGKVEFLINVTVPENITFVAASDSFATVTISKRSTEITPPANDSAYMSNGIIVSGNRGMETFGGSAASGAKAAEKFNAFKSAVGANVNVYVLPCPTASAFYAPEKYAKSIKAHSDFFGGIRDNLVDVKYVDTLAALGAHTDEYLYYRTDFHWTGLAGYYAAEALAQVAGTPFDSLSTYTEQCTESCFKGSLVRYASVLGNDPDDVYWYVPSRQHTVTYYSASGIKNPKTGMSLFSSANGYTKFMHGDTYTAHIKSDIKNGRKLVIFKNSYGNALAPYVLSSFEEVYIADIRKFQENAKEFIEQYGITDVCFAMSSHAIAGDTKNYITKLLNY